MSTFVVLFSAYLDVYLCVRSGNAVMCSLFLHIVIVTLGIMFVRSFPYALLVVDILKLKSFRKALHICLFACGSILRVTDQ